MPAVLDRRSSILDVGDRATETGGDPTATTTIPHVTTNSRQSPQAHRPPHHLPHTRLDVSHAAQAIPSWSLLFGSMYRHARRKHCRLSSFSNVLPEYNLGPEIIANCWASSRELNGLLVCVAAWTPVLLALGNDECGPDYGPTQSNLTTRARSFAKRE